MIYLTAADSSDIGSTFGQTVPERCDDGEESMTKLLGMYIHMHWGYNHPYAARTWRLDDWRAYLSGITGLGYNLLQIWPMVDSMPLPLTASDKAHLAKMRQVIDLAHREFGMTVWVVLCANTLGNKEAAKYPFESRPYFATERRINPGDADERRELMEARQVFLAPLVRADGFSIIDSDPGGYEGSPPSEFVQLLADHRRLFDAMRPGILLNYWMWQGWRDPGRPAVGDPLTPWREVVCGMMAQDLEPWGLLACYREHFQVVAELSLHDRVLYYPYNTIENEPSFPLTNCDLPRIERAFAASGPTGGDAACYPRGAMGNAQSHGLQLPHTYFFAQLARGRQAINLAMFAEELIPGLGADIAEGWNALAGNDGGRIASARARLLAARRATLVAGRLGGLLFGDPARFLDDLIAQLAWKGATVGLAEALASGENLLPAARGLVVTLEGWAVRHGFQDFYGGPFRDILHPLLARLAERLPHGHYLASALAEYDALGRHHVPQRHGAFTRLLQGLKASLA